MELKEEDKAIIREVAEREGSKAIIELKTIQAVREYLFIKGYTLHEEVTYFDIFRFLAELYPWFGMYKLHNWIQLKRQYPNHITENKKHIYLTQRQKDLFSAGMAQLSVSCRTLTDMTTHFVYMDFLSDIPVDVICYLVWDWFVDKKPQLGKGVQLMYGDVQLPEEVSVSTPKKKDMVNSPAHYQLLPGVEVIDIIRAATKDMPGDEGYELGNAIKYLLRYRHKGNEIQDLEKCRKHLEWLIRRYAYANK